VHRREVATERYVAKLIADGMGTADAARSMSIVS